jgi:hypothetical protein
MLPEAARRDAMRGRHPRRCGYDGRERNELPPGREDVVEDRRSRGRRSGGLGLARGRWRFAGPVAVGLLAVVLVGCPSTADPPATTITVEGRVLAREGTPLAGVLVHAQGELTTTEADGGFRLEGIEPPYTLTLGSGGSSPWVHAYEGLTATAPLLVPKGPQADAYVSWLGGAFLGLGNLPDDERVIVGVEGIAAPAFGLGEAGGGATSYLASVWWYGPGATVPARVHALRARVDAQGYPIAYFGYDVHDVTVTNGGTTVHDVLLNQVVPDSRLDGTVAVAGGGLLTNTQVLARFDASYGLLVATAPASATLNAPVPDIGDGSVVAVAEAEYAYGKTVAWTSVPVGPPFVLEVPTPPQLLAPVPGVADVTAATEFRAEGGPAGGRLFVWEPNAPADGPTLAVTTAADAARMPDVTPLGLALVPGGRYRWSVRALAAENYAAAVSVPAIDRGLLVYGVLGTVPQDGAIAASTSRVMTLAP